MLTGSALPSKQGIDSLSPWWSDMAPLQGPLLKLGLELQKKVEVVEIRA
jgi:hypothetical protein